MFDDPSAQFVEGGLAAYRAFSRSIAGDAAGESSDLRLAKDAALELFHLREHVPWTKGRHWPIRLARCPDYVLLQDIVNVLKHGARRDGQVAAPTDIYELNILTEYEDELGAFQHLEKVVAVELRGGSWRDMKEILTSVVNMWIADFQEHGLLDQLELIPPPQPEIPRRASKSGAAAQTLRLLQGIRFKTQFRRRKYNYTTGVVEEIDMTGHQYELSIYEPTEFSLVMTNVETGQVIEVPVKLSPEEELDYRVLKSDTERKQFEAEVAERTARRVLANSLTGTAPATT